MDLQSDFTSNATTLKAQLSARAIGGFDRLCIYFALIVLVSVSVSEVSCIKHLTSAKRCYLPLFVDGTERFLAHVCFRLQLQLVLVAPICRAARTGRDRIYIHLAVALPSHALSPTIFHFSATFAIIRTLQTKSLSITSAFCLSNYAADCPFVLIFARGFSGRCFGS